jgi:nucleotide-binding universal stress UspA family protein
MMPTLVPIDGSQSSLEALKYAARSRPKGELLLLYVAPSGRPVDLERGRFLLEDGRRTCEGITRDLQVETRLEIGDPRAKLTEVAAEAHCDLVVMGAHGVNATPHVDRLGLNPSELPEGLHPPLVLVLPTGKELRLPGREPSLLDEEEELALEGTG